MPNPQTRRQEYEAEKAALDAVNAPASAYARLDRAFFGDTSATPAGLIAWATRHLLIVLPVIAGAVGLLGFVTFKGPSEAFKAVYGWTLSKQELQIRQDQACHARAMMLGGSTDTAKLDAFEKECGTAYLLRGSGVSPEEIEFCKQYPDNDTLCVVVKEQLLKSAAAPSR